MNCYTSCFMEVPTNDKYFAKFYEFLFKWVNMGYKKKIGLTAVLGNLLGILVAFLSKKNKIINYMITIE